MKSVTLCLALLCATPALAFEPYLVKDINPLYRSDGSRPNRFTALGDVAFFEATTGEEGLEPWASDGTAAGTFLLADVCPGACSSNPRALLATPKGYFFSASNGDGERELWVSGGTPASTIRLATQVAASFEISPLYLESQGVLSFIGFVAGDGGVPVPQLWHSDGTPAGTHAVAGLPPGTIGRLALFRGRIFFSIHEGAGPSLWVSDGTAAGTRQLKRAWPGAGFPLTGLIATNRFLYFFAPSAKGYDLWRSDGTAKGTRRVADLNLFTRSSEPLLHGLTAFGDRLLFAGEADEKGDEVWVSDGTAAGTRKITNFSSPTPFGAFSFLRLSNRLVFAANDGTKGRELWGTDGTAKGTRLLVDVFPGPGSGVSFLASELLKGRVVFGGTDGRRGQELWTTDGTPQGTRMVRDVCRGSCDSSPYSLLPLNGGLLFLARSPRGLEFWKTDGTAAGTAPVTGEVPVDAAFNRIAISGKVLFARRDDVYGEELWATDGTASGTGLVADLNDANQAGSFPADFMRLGDDLVFLADDGQRRGLWKSDGTAAGTTLVHAFDVDPETSLIFGDWEEAGEILYFALSLEGEPFPSLWRTDGTDAGTFPLDFGHLELAGELRAVGDRLFFVLRDETFIYSLGVTDGTPEGTRILSGNDWLSTATGPRELTAFENRLYFFAGNPNGLWVSDGTDAGTAELLPFERDLSNLTLHQGFLYFYADDDPFPERALWRSDGTAVGTAKAADLPPRFDANQPLFTTSAGPLLFLWDLAVEGQGGLWVSDGTTAGTKWISPVRLADPFFAFAPPTVLDGVVYFAGRLNNQATLWRSDGTSAGTFPVLEAPTRLDSLTTAGGLLFFQQLDALWRSDGTAAGTAEVRDRVGSSLFVIGPRVFFPAYDPATGTELWGIDTRED